MKALILEKSEGGNRLSPISAEEAEAKVQAGRAVKLRDGLYQTKVAQPATPQQADEQDEEPQTYHTRDMVATPGQRRRNRRNARRAASNRTE